MKSRKAEDTNANFKK